MKQTLSDVDIVLGNISNALDFLLAETAVSSQEDEGYKTGRLTTLLQVKGLVANHRARLDGSAIDE